MSSKAKSHARSGSQGESTVSGWDGATSLDLCPRPVTTAGCVIIKTGDGEWAEL